jgi:hypothetical protein
MDKNWSIRDYIDGDEKGVNELFNAIFSKTRTLEHWNWEFKNNPEGSKILVVEEKEQIIAHLASIHRTVKIENQDFFASLEVDGMTHPDFGRRGIFVALGKKLLFESEEKGIDIVLGFPNVKALPGHRKLGCIELFSLNVMIRPLNFRNISNKMFTNKLLGKLSEIFGKFTFKFFYKARKTGIDEGVVLKTIKEFGDRFDRFWEGAQASYPIILQRDRKYMNWKYIDCPHRDYKSFVAEKEGRYLAVVVVRVLEKFGLTNGAIADILALPNQEQNVQGLLLKAMEYLKEKKVDLIACSVPEWSVHNGTLRKCGFMKCPKKLNPKGEPFIIYPISKKGDTDFIKNPSNWYITWGDTDVV